ncbi:MAG: ABC transporter transmembrane domain-containing protein [Patescibacteria group bacterium]|nr:ABC transporter transmembrane domain-containing protein [Patescibacteria group bacterium]
MFIKDPHLARVFKMIREPKRLYLGMTAAVISTTIGTAVPFIYGRLVDLAIKVPYVETKAIVVWIAAWLVLSVFADTLARYSGRQAYEIGIDLTNDLLVDVFHHLIDLPLGFHKTQKVGKVLKRVDRSLTDLLGLIDRTLFAFLPAVLSFFISIIALIFVSRRHLDDYRHSRAFYLWPVGGFGDQSALYGNEGDRRLDSCLACTFRFCRHLGSLQRPAGL